MLLVYLSIVRRRPWRATLRAAVLYGVPCAALVLPWYLRSYLLTGNPVYPFLPAIFGANPINDSVKRIMAWFGVGHGVSDLLLAPWHLLSRGDKFENGQFLSPLILLLAPVVIWRARRPGERQGLALVALCWFGTWLATAHIARYLLPIQPLAAVLAADALKDLLASTTFRRRLAVATAAVFIAFGAFTTLLYDAQFVSVVVGRESEDAYLRRTSWFYLAHQDLARELPGSSRVLTDDVPTYYLRIPHQRMAPADYLGGPERLTEVIRAGRFSHVVVHGNAEIIALVSRLAPRVRQVWTRAYEMPQSRSFGGSTPIPVTLYEVVPPL
jgi:hypothetical protein